MNTITALTLVVSFTIICVILLAHLTEKNRILKEKIEERERAEKKVKSSTQRYQAIFENSVLGITITDKDGTILQVNDKWLNMMGYKREEVLNKNIINFIAEDNKHADTELINKLMKDMVESYDLERKYVRSDGRVFWGHLFMTTIDDKDNDEKVKLGMVQDITNRKLDEEVLKRSEQRFRSIITQVASGISNTENSDKSSLYEDDLKDIENIVDRKNKLSLKLEEINIELERMFKKELDENKKKEALIIHQARLAAMGEMVGNIAHQWRQPLNNLGLIISNIQDAYEYNELNKHYLSTSVERCRNLISKMSDTIDDFRDFLNPNNKKEKFSIRESILTVIYLLEENLKFNNVKVELSGLESVSGYGYSNQYLQAVFNIINNSIDALVSSNKKDKYILINISENSEMVIVDFKDNGIGLSKDIEEKIFDIYFTTKDSSKGTGLGLYITKTIIENNMRGKVEIIDVNEGADIRVAIPKIKEENIKDE
ncbi:PAS/PAC sensor signal transduction histidine kinase [Gottschalkia acidurici 9a]|uniref:histidine kinase n=1 Tax=Gottschalkia acidurici (strain ATCC 7906 / DSM 604 / BCRC 14475 / CIP 104303 / KCTC 5404 / NCIMB 10678 / 9a) TaxID=1128398 RepID=K0ATI9_GOTA9|nr:PAS domain-containing sensor histidine kinase [Gottschalkia acidurici]AFS77173.1 PAS/PAC sensor signal transduction histidine kinase [Gottschalkia acidurici 9a]